MSLMSPRLLFLASAGALVLVAIGMPASAAAGAYVWPLTVNQPMAVGFNQGQNFLSASCKVTLSGRVVGSGTTAQTPYAVSTTPGASVTLSVTVRPQSLTRQPNGSFTAPLLFAGARVNCLVTVIGSRPRATGQSTLALPPIVAPVGPITPVVAGRKYQGTAPQPSSVTMPNITISKP